MESLLSDLILALSVILIYSPTRSGPFLFDDLVVLPQTLLTTYIRDPQAPHPLVFFFRGFWANRHSFKQLLHHIRQRPLLYFTYNLNAYHSGLHPGPWHWTNIYLHTLASVLVLHIARYWLGSLVLSTMVGFLFAVHPLSTMAVSYISGRSSVLCSVFMLASILAFVYHLYIFTFVLGLLAILSKPEAIVLPFLLGGVWWLRP